MDRYEMERLEMLEEYTNLLKMVSSKLAFLTSNPHTFYGIVIDLGEFQGYNTPEVVFDCVMNECITASLKGKTITVTPEGIIEAWKSLPERIRIGRFGSRVDDMSTVDASYVVEALFGYYDLVNSRRPCQ